jgi:hypothetical protein
MRTRILSAVLVLIGAGGLVRAEDKPAMPADTDKRVVAAVYDAAMMGTEIFNKGNHEGCYRLYQGVLMGLIPSLDQHAKLQTTAKMRLERAAKMPKAADAAFELRAALDDIQNELAPPKKTTLWDRLGGEPNVRKVVDDIVAVVVEDKKVNFLRDGKYKPTAKDAHQRQLRRAAQVHRAEHGRIPQGDDDYRRRVRRHEGRHRRRAEEVQGVRRGHRSARQGGGEHPRRHRRKEEVTPGSDAKPPKKDGEVLTQSRQDAKKTERRAEK